jgi:hypothetical protein
MMHSPHTAHLEFESDPRIVLGYATILLSNAIRLYPGRRHRLLGPLPRIEVRGSSVFRVYLRIELAK